MIINDTISFLFMMSVNKLKNNIALKSLYSMVTVMLVKWDKSFNTRDFFLSFAT